MIVIIVIISSSSGIITIMIISIIMNNNMITMICFIAAGREGRTQRGGDSAGVGGKRSWEGGGSILFAEILLPRIARQGTICLVSAYNIGG